MNEELQSTNEELEAINNEFRDRTHQLNQSNYFLEGILGSLQAGVRLPNRRGRQVLCKVNISAMRDRDDHVHGVILVMAAQKEDETS